MIYLFAWLLPAPFIAAVLSPVIIETGGNRMLASIAALLWPAGIVVAIVSAVYQGLLSIAEKIHAR